MPAPRVSVMSSPMTDTRPACFPAWTARVLQNRCTGRRTLEGTRSPCSMSDGHDGAVAVIHVAGAAYAHPGGSELFSDVSFRVGTGRHAALVGVNGVGKSTLLRCIAGELRPTDGSISVDGSVAYMPQAIGTDTDAGTTVRELLARFSPPAVRDAATAVAAAEVANDVEPTERTG